MWSRMPPGVRAGIAKVPQTAIAARLARRMTRTQLRVLGFHGVVDLTQFAGLVDSICRDHRPVDEDAVAAAVHGEAPLPDRCVWFTFDDGLASTFGAGKMLSERGIHATAFVNPAVVAAPGRLWFQTVEAAEGTGLISAEDAGPLKQRWRTCDEPQMRREVADLEQRLVDLSVPLPERVGVGHLHEWLRLGHRIGNHTWDHPFLDRCAATSVGEQIRQAHEFLVENGCHPTSFAYPNGNFAEPAESVLTELGYRLGVLFDHRLARTPGHPLRVSRLRIDSDASIARARSLLSGAHSAAAGLILGGR